MNLKFKLELKEKTGQGEKGIQRKVASQEKTGKRGGRAARI